MFKTFIKFITTRFLVGKLFENIKSNFLIITIPFLIIISFFYIPYEYFSYLEFKERFPNDIFGVYFILARPFIVIFLVLFVIFSFHKKIKKLELEKIEKLKKQEQERLEKIRIAKEKIEKIKSSAVVSVTEKSVSKPIVGAGVGAGLGAVAGGSLGVMGKVAGVFVAVNAGWVLAPIGALIGYLGVKALKKKKDKKDD